VPCCLAGLAAWTETSSFATQGINAVFQRAARDEIQRLQRYCAGFGLAGLLLATLAVGLGWTARHAGRGSKWACTPGRTGIVLGVLALILLFGFIP
jgi:hypothetical protein